MKSKIDEVKNLQKIAGLLKEDDDFDLSYNPLSTKLHTEEEIFSGEVIFIRDIEENSAIMFCFANKDGITYFIPDYEDLEHLEDNTIFYTPDEEEREVCILKSGFSIQSLVEKGKELGFFTEAEAEEDDDDYGEIYFYHKDYQKIIEWIKSLLVTSNLEEEEDFDLSYNPLKPIDDKKVITSWYWNSNPYVGDLSPKEVEAGIESHFDEWITVKSHYGSIEDYLDDVDSKGDWY